MLENIHKISKIEFATDPSQCYGANLSHSVKELNLYLSKLNKLFEKEQNNFAELCFYVYKVKELFDDYNKSYYGRFLDKNKNYIFFRDIMQGFGIDETQSSRLISCYDKYLVSASEKPTLIVEFAGFSKSKLFELLVVPNQQIMADMSSKVLKPEMSVVQIRAYVKNYKAMLKVNNKNSSDFKPQEDKPEPVDEEIPPAYDPKKHYEFSYFKNKTKSQLLNMIWDLQKEYEKIKKEKIKKC